MRHGAVGAYSTAVLSGLTCCQSLRLRVPLRSQQPFSQDFQTSIFEGHGGQHFFDGGFAGQHDFAGGFLQRLHALFDRLRA